MVLNMFINYSMTIFYLPNVQIKLFHKKCVSNMNLSKCYDESIFYSSSGVFSLRNNKIYRQMYIHKPIETICFEEVLLYKDDSLISYKEIFSQIPVDYDIIKYKKYIYCAKDNDALHFVIIFKESELYDCYIEASNNLVDNLVLKSLVLSFLSQ